MKKLVVLVLAVGCAGTVPETRYYQLAAHQSAEPKTGAAMISVEPLATDGAYDDERIVYRLNPYRLDYYNYHRWSATPGSLVGSYLEQALAKSGKFRAVLREGGESAPVVLGGRVLAIEEVDVSKTSWRGRIALELTLSDTVSGQVLWSERFEETESLPAQNPEGLARAISTAMNRIVQRALPPVADFAEKQMTVHEARAAERAARRGGASRAERLEK